MLVTNGLVAVEVLIHRVEQVVVRLDVAFACARQARVAHRHQRCCEVDESGLEQWHQRQDHRGGEAAGIADYRRRTDRIGVHFAEAIDRRRQQLRTRVIVAVPLLVGSMVMQPELRADVDQLEAGLQQLGHHLGDLGRFFRQDHRLGAAGADGFGCVG